jgi:hypothetical protein
MNFGIGSTSLNIVFTYSVIEILFVNSPAHTYQESFDRNKFRGEHQENYSPAPGDNLL